MKTIQANSYEQAAKSLEGLQTGLSERITSEIRADEKNHYHIVTVKIHPPKYGKMKAEADIVIVKTYQRQFEKLEKNHHYFGYSHVFLLHNPTLNKLEEENPPVTQTVDVEAIKRDAMAEADKKIAAAQEAMEAKNAAFLEEMKKQFAGQAATTTAPTNEEQKEGSKIQGYINAVTESREINLEEFSKQHPNQLTQFAKEFGIDLNGKTKKAEIMPTIIAWVEQHNQGINQ